MRTTTVLWLTSAAMLAGLVGVGIVQSADLPSAHPPLTKFSKVSELVKDKCMACHTRDYDLPFYASIPGIKQIIEKDYTDGLRAMDLRLELTETAKGNPISEVVLAKMEWVVQNSTMPPAKFTAVNWGSRLSDADKVAILDWVKTSRANHYATGSAVAARSNEPLQPLPDALPVDAKKVTVGEKLFNDKRLSGDDTVSCASCHELGKGGTDNARFASGVREQKGDVNAPTVFNAVFHTRQFWDGRSADLQEQAGGPPFNPIEMDSKDWDQVITKLEMDKALTDEFKAAYPDGWNGKNITDAIAEYEMTLITPNSRFDQWLKGNKDALNPKEIEGYERFKAYRCASCHVGKAMGGQSFEFVNLKGDYFADRAKRLQVAGMDTKMLGSDAGLNNFTKKAEDMHKFKVPTLRNIELTHPYMHDGTVTTLDESVRLMGVYLSGMDLPQKDRDSVVLFLRTLTGEHLGKKLEGQPATK